MNQLSPVLPAFSALPVVPESLAAQLDALAPSRYGSGEDRFAVAPAQPRFHPDAARLLPQFEHACRAPEPHIVRTWFTRLAAAVRNPPAGGDFEERVAAIAGTVADLPACVWTSATLNEACRTWTWWPSAADVDALLRPRAIEVWRKRDSLRRIAEAGQQPAVRPERPPPTKAECEQVSAIVRAFVAEREQAPKPPDSRLSVPRTEADERAFLGALRQAAEAGDAGAAARLAWRRERGMAA